MDTRQQILEATQRIVLARGIVHATTKQIAHEAGCSEGALYRHFASKEELFLALMQLTLPAFIEALDANSVDEAPITVNLRRIALAAIEYFEQLLPLTAVFLADSAMLERHRQLLQTIQGGPQRVYERSVVFIERAQQRGQLTASVPPLQIATLLFSPCLQYVFNRSLVGDSPLVPSEQEFVDTLLQSLSVAIIAVQ